jgi:tetraacyldisaccharide 4'-kinase
MPDWSSTTHILSTGVIDTRQKVFYLFMTTLQPLGNTFLSRAASLLYLIIIYVRNLWFDAVPWAVKKTGRFTVSVGGIHAGGTGKTPLALLLGHHFSEKGYAVAFLSRGYGRRSAKPVILPPYEFTRWEEIGDEPAMLRNNLPRSWLGIGARRIKNARAISRLLPEKSLFILDDGFQHRNIFRNVNVVCLPPNPDRDCILPAGFLREPLISLKRAQAICLVGLYEEREILEKNKKLLSTFCNPCIIFNLYQKAESWVRLKSGVASQSLPCKNPLLISGIARPYRIREMVAGLGITPYGCVSYEDHHVFNTEEISSLCTPSVDGIITTEKDSIKLSANSFENCPDIWYLKIRLLFFDKEAEKQFFYIFSCEKG